MLKFKSKVPLPMFMLTFEHDENIKKIYEIKDILGMKVEIHAIRKSKLVPQCKNCQKYGHTHKYCSSNPRCVRCAGNHHTKDCMRKKDEPAKCANCNEKHPANYRGCLVAKQIQLAKDKKHKQTKPNSEKDAPKVIKDLQPRTPKEVPKVHKIIKKVLRPKTGAGTELTYAQAASKNVEKPITTTKTKSNASMETFMQKILNRMESMEKSNKAILERISFLERKSSNKKAAQKRQT